MRDGDVAHLLQAVVEHSHRRRLAGARFPGDEREAPLADLLADALGLSQQGRGLLDLAQVRVGEAEVAEASAFAPPVANLAGNYEPLLVVADCLLDLAQ